MYQLSQRDPIESDDVVMQPAYGGQIRVPALRFAAPAMRDAWEPVPWQSATGTTSAMSSGTMRVAFGEAQTDGTWTAISAMSGTTAAGATPTLFRFGVYEEGAQGSDTYNLIGATANDTSLFAAASTIYTRALVPASPFGAVRHRRGRRYAIGVCLVTAAATPTIAAAAVNSAIAALAPRVTGAMTASDLPASFAASSLSGTGVAWWSRLV